MRAVSKGAVFFLFWFLSNLFLLEAQAKGDLSRKPIPLPDLVLGSDVSDYAMSQKIYQLETGKAYKLNIVSSGFKEYAIEAPGFFASIYLRKVEVAGMEIKAVSLTQLEFE